MTMVIEASMEITAAKFKAQCLKLMDIVAETNQPLTITKRGRPVARLVPVPQADARPVFGFLKGHVVEEGDIVSPTLEKWEADAG
jgi:prevent-host-death family protein